MRLPKAAFSIFAIGFFLLTPMLIHAQDADQQKLIDIEKDFAATPNSGPHAGQLAKQYFYDGDMAQVTPIGRVGFLPKSRMVELLSTPDPSDPNAKISLTLSDFQVHIYGETALVAYKEVETDTGHKDPGMNATDHYGCLDTFVKRAGQWYLAGSACASTAPIPQSEWDAVKKAIAAEPKDVQQAFH